MFGTRSCILKSNNAIFSQCSKNCEVGTKTREVHCFDMRDQRLLRPFHCWAMSSRPQSQMPCNLQPCLTWYTSSWGQVSDMESIVKDNIEKSDNILPVQSFQVCPCEVLYMFCQRNEKDKTPNYKIQIS